MKNRIIIVTGSRADYGLLFPLIKEFSNSNIFDVEIIVTGMHLSKKHGYSVELIAEDNVEISYKVDLQQAGDTPYDINKAISDGITAFSKIFSSNEFDLLIVLGDRYEIWAAAIAAVFHQIPIAHIHGGEVTEGAVDEYIRHSITKMSALHFPSIEAYKKRIIQMGENPENVFSVGALGIDNIKNFDFMSVEELNSYTGVDFTENNIALLTYHPVTLNHPSEALYQITQVFEALLAVDINVLITMPNSDVGGNEIYNGIKDYSNSYPHKFKLIKNLGQKGYLSSMKYSRLMVGNSSSGIIESASFKLPVVNIGDRQQGRYKPRNVIDCSCEKPEIVKAINIAISKNFSESLSNLDNPYGDGNAAKRIIRILESIDLKDKYKLLKKTFNDIKYIL